MSVFRQSPDFSLDEGDNGLVHFVHANGRRVQTDELFARIWKSLPGTGEEIRRRLGEDADLSARMLADILRLLVRAEIVIEEGAAPAEDGTVPVTALQASSSVSAVIVTYNSAAHIRDCLASLRGQTAPPREILTIDNGSTDGTLDIIRGEFPEVFVHALPRNLFYPGGMNEGMARSGGEFILFLNDDIVLDPGAVAEMVRVMEAFHRAAAIAPMLKFYFLRGFLNGIGNQVQPKGWGSDNFIGFVDVGQFEGLTEVPSACVSAVLVRRAAFEDVGPFDASFRAYYEDPDWCFRARLRGWIIAAAPRAVVEHKFNAYWEDRPSRLVYIARNRLRLVVKNFDGPIFRAFLRSYMKEDAKNTLHLLRQRRRAGVIAYAKAYISLLAHLPRDLRARFQLRKRRRQGVSIESILALNPVPWTGLNGLNEPTLDTQLYYAYYRFKMR